MRVLTIALFLLGLLCPALLLDLARFARSEWRYLRFRRLFSGASDEHLRADWTSAETDELRGRLKAGRIRGVARAGRGRL